MIGFDDEPLLDQRHLLERQLHAEIAARHHHGIGHRHDLVEVVQRGRLLDLRDELDLRVAHEPAGLLDVLRPAHEREREIVYAGFHGVLYVLAILFRERGGGDLHAGQVHPFVRRQNAAVHHASPDPGGIDARHLDRQEPVVQQNARADARVRREAVVRRGQLVAPGLVLRRKDHLLARGQLARCREIAYPNPGTLQVEQHGDGHVRALRDAARRGDPPRPRLGGPMRRIDPEDIGASLKQGADRGLIAGRGPQGRDDLGAPDPRHPVGAVIHKCARSLKCGKLDRMRRALHGELIATLV